MNRGPLIHAENIVAGAALAAVGPGVTVAPKLILPMTAFAGLTYILLRPKPYRRISRVQPSGARQITVTRASSNPTRHASAESNPDVFPLTPPALSRPPPGKLFTVPDKLT